LTRLRSAQHLALQAALVEMREATNLNQRDFATRLGRNKSFVWRMEVGERRAQVVELVEISWAAGFSPQSVIQRIQSRGPLVARAESRIEIPVGLRLRAFMARTLIEEIVKAREAAEQSKRGLSAEIGRSDSYVWKIEERRRLDVIEFLTLGDALSFNAADVVGTVARAAVARSADDT
jgi:ribosome-binding protein aMBF1 (putative translation factor)